MKSLKDQLNQAEQRARQRDQKIQQKNHIDLEVVNQVEEKAKDLGYGIYKVRSKNQAAFVQTIEDNWDIIIRKGFLTSGELSFIMSIQSLIEFNVNAIADRETGQFMTISEIARYLNMSRTRISTLVKNLLKKGVLFEFVDVEEIKEFNRNVTARSLFINPELFYAGDRNKIDGTLSMLVSRYDKLEKNNILLDWKVWKESGHSHGRLYRRKTYLNFKNRK